MRQNLLRKNRSLEKVKPSDVALSEERPLFINESLIPLLQGFIEKMQRIVERKNYIFFLHYQWQRQEHFRRRWQSIHRHPQKISECLLWVSLCNVIICCIFGIYIFIYFGIVNNFDLFFIWIFWNLFWPNHLWLRLFQYMSLINLINMLLFFFYFAVEI